MKKIKNLHEKGKLSERVGRKAMGLRSEKDYGCQVAVRNSGVTSYPGHLFILQDVYLIADVTAEERNDLNGEANNNG